MIPILWSPQALRDLEAIREYIRPYRIVYRPQAAEVEIVTAFRASRLLLDLE